ncbi:MAG: ABC transporter ATP-binding protein [Actinomycetota bacterium]
MTGEQAGTSFGAPIDIEVENVGKRYRRSTSGMPRRLVTLADRGPRADEWALRDVSFSIARGETFGLIGKNGSGKSTLLRLLGGLTRPTTGSVRIARRVSGLLTLGEGLHPLMTGEENAVTGAILAGLTRDQARRRLPEITAFAELEDHMDQPLRTFSDGMRLRLAFSVAAHVEPEILLIDEILAVGDLRFQEKCFAYLQDLQSSGVSVVVASHDLNQIRRLCHRASWIADGKVRAVGDAAEVADRYETSMTEGVPVRDPGELATHRLGTGEVEIISLRLLNSNGHETAQIPSGGAFTVEIDFVAHARVDDPIFGISAHSTRDGTRCFDLSTASDGHLLGALDGKGTVQLQIDRLDLGGGSYHLDVGVYESSWDRPYDYLWQAFPLEVTGSDGQGVLDPPHRWSLR